MTTSPRDALDRLVAALEAHYGAVTRRTGEADPAVIAAYQTLADAFEMYDNALYDKFDEVTPFELVDESDDLDDDDLDDDDELDEDLDDLDDLDGFVDNTDGADDTDGANGQKRSG